MEELVPSSLHYSAHVCPIPGRIEGTAFFPGGSGLYSRDSAVTEFPHGGAMILGHNFDSEAGFQQSFQRGREVVTKGTWAALLDLLDKAGIPLEQCFFTNAFMGLCEGADNKKYLGRDNPDFRAACLRLLKVQIETQRPRFILTLGLHVPPLLAAASADLTAWNGKCKRNGCDPRLHLADLDAAPFFPRVRFQLDDGPTTHIAVVTAIAHPSDRRNGDRRTPSGFPFGRAGELEMIRRGWETSGVSSVGCRS